ncbi:zinc finger MYM-type protein 1-like [Spodoptera litura]|uniref:Zinc finger MYM-type protein 1-like n=1 Tax=Spodoptera litura TaxID=69820 RepID=A0A9J7IZ34_SPOLT|nr:zinc finger MYM-type protein 1-like [Spodoptera litura]
MSDSNNDKKKKLSGYQNLIRKRKQEEERNKNATKISKYFTALPSTSTQSLETETSHVIDESVIKSDSKNASCGDDAAELTSVPDTLSTPSRQLSSPIPTFSKDDPGAWPEVLNATLIEYLIENPIKQIKQYNFPRDSSGRKFSEYYYERHLGNGEKYHREWLLYSVSKNAVYCFCCKLFESKYKNKFCEGISDWQHLALYCSRHEKSSAHFNNYKKWTDLCHALKNKNTIDSIQQKLLEVEKQRWYDVIKRIIYVVQFLSTQNMAFRGQSQKLYDRNNGNFLKCIEMLGKFDLSMTEHIRRVMNDTDFKNMPTYLGDKIQNEIIHILGKQIQDFILNLFQINKYFAIILDCTPDVSHVEQISIIIRFVNFNTESRKLEIREHFLAFCPIVDTTGAGLTSFIIEKLNNINLNINNLRGQGYDNGSNMRGKNNGLQKRLLDLNPRAFYVPCASHSLNLIVNDSANLNHHTTGFFCIVQELYKYFSSSAKRWDLLKKYVINLTLKPLSETRWSSRIDAIKPLFTNLPEIYDALYEITNNLSYDPKAKYDAKCLAEKICTFSFICSLNVWHIILTKVNFVSKILQSVDMNLQVALDALTDLKKILIKIRTDTNFEEIVSDAKKIAEKLDVETEFETSRSRPLRCRKTPKNFDYEHEDHTINDPKTSFKINVFFYILDQALSSVNERFNLLNNHNDVFNFLFNLSDDQDQTRLRSNCHLLQEKLSANDSLDINADDLFEEIMSCQPFFKKLNNNVVKILEFIYLNNLTAVCPNITIALRIMLTMPVTVASAERSFSKLKLIKNYLRSTMSQERLTNLATISIEEAILDHIDIHEIIKDFANKKARKVEIL